MTRSEFLAALANNDAFRARFVEVLRSSAEVLDGLSPWVQIIDDHNQQARHEVAAHLHLAAHALCDHARVRDGVCRYCDGEVSE